MLIQGGMISSGRLNCFLVVGLNCSSWIRSFWNTTLPGVVATFLPSSKAVGSVILIAQLAVAVLDVAQQVVEALEQVLAVVLTVSRSTSGLVMAKLDGDSASMNWRVKKFDLLLASGRRGPRRR